MTSLARRSGLIALFVVLLVSATSPAGAHLTQRSDPDDTQGPLDIRQGSFDHRNGRFFSTLKTQGDWEPAMLLVGADDSNDNGLDFWYETKGSREVADYVAVVDYDSESLALAAWVRKVVSLAGGGYRYPLIEKVGAVKEGREVRINVSRSLLTIRDSGKIAWSFDSFYTGKSQCTSTCFDYAPNQYMYEHGL